MPFLPVVPNVYEFNNGPVNIWLIAGADGLTLIDTNYQGREQIILDAVQALGHKPQDIHHILLTHCHPDHAGSLAALKKLTGAEAWMHKADADVVRGRVDMVRSAVSPGLINKILYQVFIKNVPGVVPAAEVEHEIQDGETVPAGGELKAVHTPGHSAGHTAYLLERGGGVLFLGDACSNMAGLGYSVVYDDIEMGRQSLKKLAGLKVETICFSHGKALKGKGAARFREKWS